MKAKTTGIIMVVAAVAIAALGIRLLFVKTAFKYGLILLAAVALGFLIWKAFIKSGQDALRKSEDTRRELDREVADLRRQLNEITHSPLNVASLTPVLHLAVLNIDTSFTRTYIREDEDRGLTFNGALRAEIIAEYGIRLEDVKFRYDSENNTLWLANFEPGLLSFSKKQLHWDIANAMHSRSIAGFELPAANDKAAKDFVKEMKETIREEVEKEIDRRRIAEFEWLAPVVSRQVTDVLRTAIGHPEAHVTVMVDAPAGDGFLPLNEFYVDNQK